MWKSVAQQCRLRLLEVAGKLLVSELLNTDNETRKETIIFLEHLVNVSDVSNIDSFSLTFVPVKILINIPQFSFNIISLFQRNK